MHTPPRILVVDDHLQNTDLLKDRLEIHGYEVLTATAGEEALALAATQQPDLILLDILMPGMDGLEVCRRLKAHSALPFIPVIMVTAKWEPQDIVAGFEAGADAYITKPVDQTALLARITSMLHWKSRYDAAIDQATRSASHADHLAQWNQHLEEQLAQQVTDLERMGLLKRFLPPQLAEWVLSFRAEDAFVTERREVTLVCCTVHGFPTFVETTVPEEVVAVLRAYHTSIGQYVTQFDGTVERCAGEELLVVFNAPLVCPDPVDRAVHMAIAMRGQFDTLMSSWRARGYALDVGIGIAHGHATLGLMELDGRWDYAVIGAVRRLASCLSAQAHHGTILVSQSVWDGIKARFQADPGGALHIPGSADPIPCFAIRGSRDTP